MKTTRLIFLFSMLFGIASAEWQYDIKKDKMRRTERHFARLASSNKEAIDKKNTNMIIALVQGDISAAYLTTAPSAVLNKCTEKCTIQARFDNEEIESINVINHGDTLKIQDVESFIKKLSTHKELVIEVYFDNNAAKQFEFPIKDLKTNF